MTKSAPPQAALEPAPPRPAALRRAAVVVTGMLAAALPLSWGISSVGQLVTGQAADHRFHQLTGQGVLLAGLWLGALVPLVVAGWRGVRPGTAPALAHVAVVAAAVVAGALAPANGDAVVAAIVVGTGALLWLALPRRPRIAVGGADPVRTPLALLTAALYLPYALGQASLQRQLTDEHARLSHYFDMAWIAVLLVLLAVAAAVVPTARRLALVAAAAGIVVGGARLALTGSGAEWSLFALALGVVGGLLVTVVRRAR